MLQKAYFKCILKISCLSYNQVSLFGVNTMVRSHWNVLQKDSHHIPVPPKKRWFVYLNNLNTNWNYIWVADQLIEPLTFGAFVHKWWYILLCTTSPPSSVPVMTIYQLSLSIHFGGINITSSYSVIFWCIILPTRHDIFHKPPIVQCFS